MKLRISVGQLKDLELQKILNLGDLALSEIKLEMQNFTKYQVKF